jgi:hypothetical protein
VLPPRHP